MDGQISYWREMGGQGDVMKSINCAPLACSRQHNGHPDVK